MESPDQETYLQLIEILVGHAVEDGLGQLREGVVVVVLADCEVDKPSGDAIDISLHNHVQVFVELLVHVALDWLTAQAIV